MVTKSNISIALCTYNGAAYLSAQWDSLLAQERLPDEVVVCDDGSTDDTWSLLERLAAEAPFPVRLEKNSPSLGVNQNFGKALSLCTGDLIFICDQDDIWLPTKLRVMSDFMEAHPTLCLAFCDALLTDSAMIPTGGRFWDTVYFSPTMQAQWRAGNSLDALLDGNRVMGCATVLRKSLLNVALPIPPSEAMPGYWYDGWLALLASVQNQLSFLPEALQYYRTHTNQQVGASPPPLPPDEAGTYWQRLWRPRAQKIAPLERRRLKLEHLKLLFNERLPASAPGLLILENRLRYVTTRTTLPHARLQRIGPVWREWQRGTYHRYAQFSLGGLGALLDALDDVLA